MKYIDLIVDNRSDSTDNPYTYGCEDDSVSVGSRGVGTLRQREQAEKRVRGFRHGQRGR